MKTEAWMPPTAADLVEYVAVQQPLSVKYKTYVDENGAWTVRVDLEAFDVETGDIGHFKTVWRGVRPDTHAAQLKVIADTIATALKHELRETLGLKPHGGVE